MLRRENINVPEDNSEITSLCQSFREKANKNHSNTTAI